MAFNFTLPLRIVQAVFTFIVLVLAAYVADHTNNAWVSSPAEISFMVFAAVWTILALVYLIAAPARFPQAAHKFAILGVEFITMIFWFAGFIALAVFLGDGPCGGNSVCGSAKAATAFGAFLWALFTATLTMAALHVWRTRNTSQKSHDPNMEMHTTV